MDALGLTFQPNNSISLHDSHFERMADELCDPISLEMMVRPVITNCGHSFDKTSLKRCFKNKVKVCPTCRGKVTKLTKNFALIKMIDLYNDCKKEQQKERISKPTEAKRVEIEVASPVPEIEAQKVLSEEEIEQKINEISGYWNGGEVSKTVAVDMLMNLQQEYPFYENKWNAIMEQFLQGNPAQSFSSQTPKEEDDILEIIDHHLPQLKKGPPLPPTKPIKTPPFPPRIASTTSTYQPPQHVTPPHLRTWAKSTMNTPQQPNPYPAPQFNLPPSQTISTASTNQPSQHIIPPHPSTWAKSAMNTPKQPNSFPHEPFNAALKQDINIPTSSHIPQDASPFLLMEDDLYSEIFSNNDEELLDLPAFIVQEEKIPEKAPERESIIVDLTLEHTSLKRKQPFYTQTPLHRGPSETTQAKRPRLTIKTFNERVSDAFQLAQNGSYKRFKRALTNDVLHSRDREGNSLLHMVVKAERHYTFINLLTKKGIAIDVQNGAGKTPLHVAAEINALEMIKMLIKRNASLEILDGMGIKPEECASRRPVVNFFKNYRKKLVNPPGSLN